MKILVLRFSSIGDIVLTTPVVRALAQQVPDAEVHFATKPSYRSLLEANPYVAKVHCLTGGLGELVQQLKAERFDYVVDLHHNLRTRLLKLRLGVPASSFTTRSAPCLVRVKTSARSIFSSSTSIVSSACFSAWLTSTTSCATRSAVVAAGTADTVCGSVRN